MADHFVKIKEVPKEQRLDYIWDYYKFHILIGIVLIISLISILSTTVFRTKEDVYMVVVGGSILPTETFEEVKNTLNSLNLDVNEDGKLKHEIQNLGYSGISDITMATDTQADATMGMKINAVLSTGNHIIQIVDKNMVNAFIEQGIAGKVSDFPGKNYVNDGTYVKIPLSETKLYESFGKFKDDYVILVRGKDRVSANSDKKIKNYERQIKALDMILK